MVEVEVSGLEDTHQLQALGGLSVEGDGGGVDLLGDQALQGIDIHEQGAVGDQVAETVEQRVHAEQTLRL